MDTLIFLNHFRRSPLFLFCPSSSDKEKNVGKKKPWKPTTFYYLISGKPLVSTGNLAYVLQTSFTGLFLGGDTTSAKNLVSQLSLPEQFLLFLFTFSWNWSLPASTCSWEAPYSSGSSTFQQPCEWPRTSSTRLLPRRSRCWQRCFPHSHSAVSAESSLFPYEP